MNKVWKIIIWSSIIAITVVVIIRVVPVKQVVIQRFQVKVIPWVARQMILKENALQPTGQDRLFIFSENSESEIGEGRFNYHRNVNGAQAAGKLCIIPSLDGFSILAVSDTVKYNTVISKIRYWLLRKDVHEFRRSLKAIKEYLEAKRWSSLGMTFNKEDRPALWLATVADTAFSPIEHSYFNQQASRCRTLLENKIVFNDSVQVINLRFIKEGLAVTETGFYLIGNVKDTIPGITIHSLPPARYITGSFHRKKMNLEEVGIVLTDWIKRHQLYLPTTHWIEYKTYKKDRQFNYDDSALIVQPVFNFPSF